MTWVKKIAYLLIEVDDLNDEFHEAIDSCVFDRDGNFRKNGLANLENLYNRILKLF